MGVRVLASHAEFKKAISAGKPIVIDFCEFCDLLFRLPGLLLLTSTSGATWCGPCRMISPVFEKLSEGSAAEKIDFYKVDVDEQDQIAAECGIKAMPTFIFFKNGEAVKTVKGANPPELAVSRAQMQNPSLATD